MPNAWPLIRRGGTPVFSQIERHKPLAPANNGNVHVLPTEPFTNRHCVSILFAFKLEPLEKSLLYNFVAQHMGHEREIGATYCG